MHDSKPILRKRFFQTIILGHTATIVATDESCEQISIVDTVNMLNTAIIKCSIRAQDNMCADSVLTKTIARTF